MKQPSWFVGHKYIRNNIFSDTQSYFSLRLGMFTLFTERAVREGGQGKR